MSQTPVNIDISTMTKVVTHPFINLTLQDGSIFGFTCNHMKRRNRIKCVRNYIKENPHNITPNTIRLLKLYAKMSVCNINRCIDTHLVYVTLPGVYDRVDNFLNGKSGGVWPLLYTLSLLWALIKSGLWVNNESDFWYRVSLGSKVPIYKHVLDLRYVVSKVPDESHDIQLKFMTIMNGIQSFGSSGLDPAMITHMCAFMSSPNYIDILKANVERKAAKKAAKKADTSIELGIKTNW